MAYIIEMPNVVPLESPEDNRSIFQERSGLRERITSTQSRRERHEVIPISPPTSITSRYETSSKIQRVFDWVFNFIVGDENNPTHLKAYIDLLTTFGISPLNSNYNAVQPLWHWILFIVLSVIVIFRKFAQAKMFIFLYAEKGNLIDTIKVLQFVLTFVESVYLFYLFSTKRVFEFLKTWPTANQSGEINIRGKCCSTSKILLLFTILSSFALSTRSDRLAGGESYSTYLLEQAEDFLWSLLLWRYTNAVETANAISDAYVSKLTAISMSFAILQITTVYFAWFQILTIRDLVFVIVLDLSIESKKCKNEILATQVLNPGTVQDMWKTYDWAFDLSARVNECFGGLFKIIHIGNWLYCSYYLLQIHQGEWNWITDIVLGTIRLVKLAIFYCCGYSVGTLSWVVIRHVRKLCAQILGRNRDDGLKEDVILLKDMIEEFRPGIGEGFFHVDGSFLVKFGGSVISCFLLFADTITFNHIAELLQSRFQTNANNATMASA